MFSSGKTGQSAFIESSKNKDIEIDNVSYPVFTEIMKYLYSGEFELGVQVNKLLETHALELEKHHERSVSSSHRDNNASEK